MKILPQQEAHLREMVRDSLALDPLMTVRRLQKIITNNTHRTISDKYLMRLMHKVRRDVVIHSDRKKLTDRLAEIRERHETLRKQLLRIAYWSPVGSADHGITRPKASEQINAIKTVVQMDLALLKAELEVGIYEDRRVALEEMLREGLLPQELHEQVVGVFRTWKLRPSPMNVKSDVVNRTPDPAPCREYEPSNVIDQLH